MKALFIGRDYESSPAWYCGRALKKLGVEFECFDFVEVAGGYDFLHMPSKNPLVRASRKFLWRKKVGAMNHTLLRRIKQSSAGFVLLFGTETDLLFPETLRALAALKIKKILWIIDTAIDGKAPSRIITHSLPVFDLCLAADAHFPQIYRQSGAKTVEILELGCDPEIHRPLHLTPEEKETYGSPLVYIGNYFAQGEYRLSLLHLLCEKFPVKLWGRGWEKAKEPAIKKAWTGKSVYRDEMCKVYSASKICLNILPKESINLLNVRIFEAAACGAMVLTEHRERLADAYAVGKEIESFSSPDELLKKIEYFLSHEDERKKLADAGRQKTLSAHTYENRMKRLCEWAGAL